MTSPENEKHDLAWLRKEILDLFAVMEEDNRKNINRHLMEQNDKKMREAGLIGKGYPTDVAHENEGDAE